LEAEKVNLRQGTQLQEERGSSGVDVEVAKDDLEAEIATNHVVHINGLEERGEKHRPK
jgi:hypothetical protein